MIQDEKILMGEYSEMFVEKLQKLLLRVRNKLFRANIAGTAKGMLMFTTSPSLKNRTQEWTPAAASVGYQIGSHKITVTIFRATENCKPSSLSFSQKWQLSSSVLNLLMSYKGFNALLYVWPLLYFFSDWNLQLDFIKGRKLDRNSLKHCKKVYLAH